MQLKSQQTALITGASSGIGREFAVQLAARGLNLVLVARSEDKLKALAQDLNSKHGIRAEVIPADLSVSGAAQSVYDQLVKLNFLPDLLVNNAGFATHGKFEEVPLATQREEVMVNVLGVVEFAHVFLPTLLGRGGGIINVASRGGFQPAGNMAIYAATKAFVISFSEALWAENHARGVQVMALCPGAINTAFFDRLGRGAVVGTPGDAAFVVRSALDAFERGWLNVIPGWQNYVISQLPRFLPRSVVARVAERMTRTTSPQAALRGSP